jgi:uncharacterized membrane protein YoaK (UPF0700 family)
MAETLALWWLSLALIAILLGKEVRMYEKREWIKLWSLFIIGAVISAIGVAWNWWEIGMIGLVFVLMACTVIISHRFRRIEEKIGIEKE